MTNPAADWYDDPENTANYRYWDGEQWTDHRSPKYAPGSGGTVNTDSAWSVFGRTFRLFGSRWRQAVLVSIPALGGHLIGIFLIYDAIDDLFGGRAREIFETITTPGFDPTGSDKLLFESLVPEYSSTIGLRLFVAVLVIALPWWITTLALSRLFVAAANGVQQTAGEALRGGVNRLGHSFVSYLRLFVGLLVVLVIPLVLGALFPPLLILVIPVLWVAGIYFIPHVVIFSVSVAAGLRNRSPFTDAIDALKGRWGYLFRRVLVLVVAALIAGFAIGIFSQVALYLGLFAYLLVNALSQLVQGAVASAGYAVIWKDAGTPTDPALLQTELPG